VALRADARAEPVPGPRGQTSGQSLGRVFASQVGDLMVAGHRQHITNLALVQTCAQLGVVAVDLVTGHPLRRDTGI
jgi:hypothetical protein